MQLILCSFGWQTHAMWCTAHKFIQKEHFCFVTRILESMCVENLLSKTILRSFSDSKIGVGSIPQCVDQFNPVY